MLASAVALLLAAWPTPASSRDPRSGERTVTVCSHHGHGCVTGPVRRGAAEAQVRMPGGTWIGCKRDCRRTLREESLDFFETLRDRVWDN